VRVDTPVLLFSTALATLAALAVSLLPAFQSSDVAAALLAGAGLSGGRRLRRARTILVVAELAVSLVLLVGASLLGRSLARLMRTDIGVQTDHVTAGLVNLSFGRSLSMEEQRERIDRILERVRRL